MSDLTQPDVMPAGRDRAWIEINLAALHSNVAALAGFLGNKRKLMAVVKADAYGHGLVPVARAAMDAGAAWLGVATIAEGITLREAGIVDPIALLCVSSPDQAKQILDYRLIPQIGEQGMLQALSAYPLSAAFPVHIEIDTGMGRSGILPDKALSLWREASAAGFQVTGLSTHFADADGPDDQMTHQQMQRFLHVLHILEAAGAQFEWIHTSNSPALLRLPAGRQTLFRPGLLIYGLLPARYSQREWAAETIPLRASLQPVLTLKARIAVIRDLPAGHTISYGASCRLERAARAATVLIGYGDGYPRRLSNQGAVLVQGARAPILGRVCMDQIVVDVTHIPEALPGDTAVCIGSQGRETIRAEEIAAQIDTTEHEITTCLTARLPRFYEKGSRKVESCCHL